MADFDDCSQTLQEVYITVESCDGSVEDADRKLAELSCIVERMPRLNKFTLDSEDLDPHLISKYTLNVRSSTLEELESFITLGGCLCPALKILECYGGMRLERICISSFEVDYSSLQDLDLRYDGSVTDVYIGLDQLSKIIENMQMLKTLRLDNISRANCTNKISLQSETIEHITIYGMEITECNCPLLKEMHIRNLSSAMMCSQQLETLICSQQLETLGVHFDKGTDPMLQRFSEVIEQMPKLKRLEVDCSSRYQIEIRSQSLESASVGGENGVDCVGCPSLKVFTCEMGKDKKVPRLSKEIEDLRIHILPGSPLQNGTLKALSHLIEQMPKLKTLNLNVWGDGQLSIKSSSLEAIDLTNSHTLKVAECICPSLQTFRLQHRAWQRFSNGVELAASHDIRIEDSKRRDYPLSEWDFVGMDEVPKSCIVTVERHP